jgi:hypothetical protein
MARIEVSLKHTFDNGESSVTSTDIGSLPATEAAVLEQVFTHLVVQGLLRIGAYNATQRDPEFAAKLNATQTIMGLKPPAA